MSSLIPLAIRHLVESYAQWWQLPVSVEPQEDGWQLKLEGSSRLISAPLDSFSAADTPISRWTTLDAFPAGCHMLLPAPAGCTQNRQGDAWHFSKDMLGFLSCHLWRAEEMRPERRMAASAAESHGWQLESFQELPIVDLWMRAFLEFLAGHLLPDRKRFWLTFDVDAMQKWKLRSRIRHLAMAPAAAFRKQSSAWMHDTRQMFKTWHISTDPWFRVGDILPRLGDLHGAPHTPATFFWLGLPYDHRAYRYDVRSAPVAGTLRETLTSGHRVGLHGSPLHSNNPEGLATEQERLESVAGTRPLLSRQHYLRLEPGITLRHLDQLGFILDSSLGFNDAPGFRNGSSVPHRWYDWMTHTLLRIREEPLVVGDWQLHDPAHSNAEVSLQRVQALAEACRIGGGILTLLFHEIYFCEEDFPGHAAFFDRTLTWLRSEGWTPWQP